MSPGISALLNLEELSSDGLDKLMMENKLDALVTLILLWLMFLQLVNSQESIPRLDLMVKVLPLAIVLVDQKVQSQSLFRVHMALNELLRLEGLLHSYPEASIKRHINSSSPNRTLFCHLNQFKV